MARPCRPSNKGKRFLIQLGIETSKGGTGTFAAANSNVSGRCNMIRGLRSRLNKLLTGASRPTSPRQGTGIRFRPVIEGLEDRAVPTVAPYAVASVFDSAVYVFDANTGNIESTLVAPNSQSILANPAGMTVGPD